MSRSRRELLRMHLLDVPRAPEAGEAVPQERPTRRVLQGCSAEQVIDETPPPWVQQANRRQR